MFFDYRNIELFTFLFGSFSKLLGNCSIIYNWLLPSRWFCYIGFILFRGNQYKIIYQSNTLSLLKGLL